MAKWIKKSKRLTFLRIGYEFDGNWNSYIPDQYIKSFKYIVDKFNKFGVKNYVTVWKSSGYLYGDSGKLLQWYPGDEYVDWLGYSIFDHNMDTVGTGINSIAREKNKPVLICEATPKRDNLLGNGEEIYKKWYKPLFKHIYNNSDVIKGLAYINVRWKDQPMWVNNGGWGDSRIQANDYIRSEFIKEVLDSDKWDLKVNQNHKTFFKYKE